MQEINRLMHTVDKGCKLQHCTDANFSEAGEVGVGGGGGMMKDCSVVSGS